MDINRAIGCGLVLGLMVGAAALPTRGAEQPAGSTPRFDHQVRTDFFAGFAGDGSRLARGMKLCEEILAADPGHAEALVWHGSGLVFLSGTSFRAGDVEGGRARWTQGLAEMAEAVTLAPDRIAVRAPRGSALLAISRFVSATEARPLIEQGLADYEHVLAMQEPYFETLGDHPRSELLFGLAEGYARLGRLDRARSYFERIVREVPASGQAPRAKQWLASGQLPDFGSRPTCVGCHRQP